MIPKTSYDNAPTLTLTEFRPKTQIGSNQGAFARFEDTEGNLQSIWAKE